MPRYRPNIPTGRSTPHGSADDVADAVFELSEDQRLFPPAELLHQCLLGVLGDDAPKAGGRDFDLHFLADLGIGLDAPGVKDGNLVVFGDDFLRDNELGEGLNVAVLGVNGHAQFTRRANRLLCSGQQRFLDSTHQDIPVIPSRAPRIPKTAKKSAFISS